MKTINGIHLTFGNKVFVSLFLEVCPSIIESWKSSCYSSLSFDQFIEQLANTAQTDKEKRTKANKIMSKQIARRATVLIKLWKASGSTLTFDDWCLSKSVQVKAQKKN